MLFTFTFLFQATGERGGDKRCLTEGSAVSILGHVLHIYVTDSTTSYITLNRFRVNYLQTLTYFLHLCVISFACEVINNQIAPRGEGGD